ncbi:MAG: MFS transporter [Ktedonobacteraceae bacterium]|jgi:MFS transporter, FSR family, fosmidomycin resistance protein
MQQHGINWRAMAILSSGHVWTDINQGAVPALLPFLITELHLSYVAAAGLVLAATASSSIVQPFFGQYSDRHPLPWLVPTGVALAGTGIGIAGIAGNYILLFISFVLSGIGVAAFHPESSRFANYISGNKRASGMSFFALGGNIGFALGPLLVSFLIVTFGLKGTLWMLIPAGIIALILAKEVPYLMTFRTGIQNNHANSDKTLNDWSAFGRLTGVIAFRSFAYFGLLTFVPLYAITTFKISKAEANIALTLVLILGAAGTLLTGWFADKWGRKWVVVTSMALATPLILGFVTTGNIIFGLICLMLGGAAVIAPFTVTVVMGQEYLPANIGVAAGVTLGLATGLGGIGTAPLGIIADHFGLQTTLFIIAILPIMGAALTFTLPIRFDQRPWPMKETHIRKFFRIIK